METFGERLYKLRNNSALTREQLGRLIDKSETVIEAYETNYAKPDVFTLIRTAQIFGVNEDYMACMTDDPAVNENLFIKEVFVVKSLERGSGIPKMEDVVGSVFVHRQEMRGDDYYAIYAPDDSMIKSRIQKGDVLLVRRQTYANDGDIVVALIGTEKEIVRRYRREGNTVILASDTPRCGFETKKIDLTEEKFIISGVVEKIIVNLK
ncbi:MAG: helix-turn-helix domain-containing protein [Clostridia bacterium]